MESTPPCSSARIREIRERAQTWPDNITIFLAAKRFAEQVLLAAGGVNRIVCVDLYTGVNDRDQLHPQFVEARLEVSRVRKRGTIPGEHTKCIHVVDVEVHDV